MANSFIDTNWVSMKILYFLHNMLEVASMFNTDWESDFGKNFATVPLCRLNFLSAGL
jgi:hypothetical protein